MSRKKFIFFCLVVIGLVCVSFFIEQMTKLGKSEVKHEIIQKEKKKPKTQKVNKKTVFEEQQVVVESVYPYLNLEEKAASENLL
ncbi:hypothetical protein [Vagococcus sp.]|uniref:hypothetical protein n=1 Tax=Vagococcus sp. TaxID=1933889 RepID=UPI003F964341